MQNNAGFRFKVVSVLQVKRLLGAKTTVTPKRIEKMQNFAVNRGYYMPVVLSESNGSMTLLAGAATFEACLEDKRTKIPAVIVQTEGDADDLMFTLQLALLNESPDAIAVSTVLVRLIDVYSVPRKQVAEVLGKSPAWINRMESLSRNLNTAVQELIADGHISSRAAQEIARLPNDVQTPFAVSVGNEFLNKDNVAYLVNRYLDEDTGAEERDRIIHTPKVILPVERNSRARKGKDCSESARLSRAIAKCLDDATCLFNLLTRIDLDKTTVHIPDIIALADYLSELCSRIQSLFLPG